MATEYIYDDYDEIGDEGMYFDDIDDDAREWKLYHGHHPSEYLEEESPEEEIEPYWDGYINSLDTNMERDELIKDSFYDDSSYVCENNFMINYLKFKDEEYIDNLIDEVISLFRDNDLDITDYEVCETIEIDPNDFVSLSEYRKELESYANMLKEGYLEVLYNSLLPVYSYWENNAFILLFDSSDYYYEFMEENKYPMLDAIVAEYAKKYRK